MMRGHARFTSFFVLLAGISLIAVLAIGGCGKAGREGESASGEESQGAEALVGDALFQEVVNAMQGEISYRISAELDLQFQIPSASLGKTGQPYIAAPAAVPYEAFHLSKAGKSGSKAILKVDQMAVDEGVPPALLPGEMGNVFYLISGTYYWEDPSGWHAEPYDPVGSLPNLNLRGLMPEDVMNWLVYAESAEAVEEKDNAVGYQVTLGEKYLKGLKEQAQKSLSGDHLSKAIHNLKVVEKLLPAMGLFVVVDKDAKRITEVQFAYGGHFSDVFVDLPEDSPFKEMGFFYSSFMIYDSYGSQFDIQPPI
ncbi:hypothetical protein [Candidatus Solincola tengchongensis]|uniref:hypothetical protein n=1 Tax=Candidatus Solincola tengchongensis TaxID=2900693 RepID=UPI00257D9314|nr:hypothetical protein [Candidatus Solincola tengchongensis]